MSELTVSQNTSNVNEINGNQLNFIEKDGQFYLSAEEIGRSLGYELPTQAIHKIFRKNYSELNEYSIEAKLASIDGSMRNTRIFSEDGLYIISMLSRTAKARTFRKKVAETLKQIRQNQLSLTQELAYQQGMEYANSLPALEAKTKESYLSGMKEGEKIQKRKDGLVCVRKSIDYLGMGLSLKETAKLTGVTDSTIRDRLKSLGIYEKALHGDLSFEIAEKKAKKKGMDCHVAKAPRNDIKQMSLIPTDHAV